MDALLQPAIINSKEKKQRQRNIIFFNKDIKYLENEYNHRCNWQWRAQDSRAGYAHGEKIVKIAILRP